MKPGTRPPDTLALICIPAVFAGSTKLPKLSRTRFLRTLCDASLTDVGALDPLSVRPSSAPPRDNELRDECAEWRESEREPLERMDAELARR